MPVNIQIDNHVIMPFGCEKWNIDQIQVTGVSANATYFASKTKCAYIDKSKSEPLRLSNFPQFFPDDESKFPNIEDPVEALQFMQNILREKCMLGTDHEKKFIDLYFSYIRETSEKYAFAIENHSFFAGWEHDHIDERTYAGLQSIDDLMLLLHLMPFPQAHIYVDDPFMDSQAFIPNRMLRVDFAFWTGSKLLVIEIDGNSHIGSLSHVERDRLLLRAEVNVIHILNDEIDKYGVELIEKLLPPEITKIDYIPLIKKLGLGSILREDRHANSILNPFSKW